MVTTETVVQFMRATLVSYGNILMAPVIAWILCAPKYPVGTMSPREVAQVVAAFVMVQTALDWLVDNYPGAWRSACRQGTASRRYSWQWTNSMAMVLPVPGNVRARHVSLVIAKILATLRPERSLRDSRNSPCEQIRPFLIQINAV